MGRTEVQLAERKTKTLYIVTEVVDFKVFRSLLKLKVKNPLFMASSFLAKKDLKADDWTIQCYFQNYVLDHHRPGQRKSNQECLGSRRQTDKTITRVLVSISLCAKAYLIVRYRSPLIKSEWPNTVCQVTTKEMLKTKFTPQNSWKLFLCSKKIVIAPWKGWTTNPVNRSVSAKDANKTLKWVWRRRFVSRPK